MLIKLSFNSASRIFCLFVDWRLQVGVGVEVRVKNWERSSI